MINIIHAHFGRRSIGRIATAAVKYGVRQKNTSKNNQKDGSKMTLEQDLRAWSKPPGSTEESRSSNAISVIKNALNASSRLLRANHTVTTKGSWANNTNVPKESDVDVSIICTNSLFYDIPPNAQWIKNTINTSSYKYQEFRQDVFVALQSYLGYGAVKDGGNSFDLHANSYRIEADVVPVFGFRKYNSSGGYIEGTAFQSSNNKLVINYPKQRYDNGVKKNLATGRRFKRLVRATKQIYYDNNQSSWASNASSFLIECLLYNCPDRLFNPNLDYEENLRQCLNYLNQELSLYRTSYMKESNDIKLLFSSDQKWDISDAVSFVSGVKRTLRI